MKKLIVSIIVLIITKSITKTSVIINIIYDDKKTLDKNDDSNKSSSVEKKQNLLDSLSYLKSKKVKTKQDKESIYTLEMILRNMK